MNITMPPPISYPFYMDTSRQSYANNPWSTNPYQYSVPMHPQYPTTYQSTPSYPSPFILRHAQRPPALAPPPPRFLSSVSSYSNTRYNHLKQSTSYINRHRSMEVSFHQQSMPTINHYQHGRPMKTKSVTDFHQIAQANSNHLAKAHSWHSIHPSNGFHHQSHLPSSGSPSKTAARPVPLPSVMKPVLPRFSNFPEMPLIQNPIYQRSHSTSSQNSRKNQRRKTISPCHSSCSRSSSSGSHRSSSSTSFDSHRSFQQRCNGSLRTDPLLVAAMEDFQQLHRTSNLSTPVTTHRGNLSRDSLCSDSTSHSSTRSRTHSQSSFTSLERLEIRHLIKALKTKGISTFDLPIASSSPSTTVKTKPIISKPTSAAPINKHQKSSITEELDEKFAQLRSTHPNEELIYVKPSLLNKQANLISTCLLTTNKNSIIEIPRAPPLPPSIDEPMITTTKPEYAIPMKNSSDVNIRSHPKKNDQCRSFSFCKPMTDLVEETRPVSMFNWFQYGLSNPIPDHFQGKKNTTNIGKSLVKENIYASEIDVHVPCSDQKAFLNDPNLMFDYLSTCKSSTKHSSVFHDFSRLFTRFGHHHHHRQEEKCKRKSKLQKNNYLSCTLM